MTTNLTKISESIAASYPQTTYWIAPRAVTRYRELVQDINSANNVDVARRLDQALREALAKSGALRVVRDKQEPDQPTTLVDMWHGKSKYVVLMRRHDPIKEASRTMLTGPGRQGLAALQLYTAEAAEQEWAQKRWQALPQNPIAEQVQRAVEKQARDVPPIVVVEPDKKPKRGGTMLQRCARVRALILARPEIRTDGADSINSALRDEFGSIMSHKIIREVRDQLEAERAIPGPPTPPTDNILMRLAATPSPLGPPSLVAAQELAVALDAEGVARAVLKHAQEAHAAADAAYQRAKERAEEAMDAITRIRAQVE